MDSIEIINLCKEYDSKKVVKDLNLNIHDGELFGLLGVNGAGKTTTTKMLSCLIKPTSGEAIILGKSINKDQDYVKQIMNVSPQETAIAPKLTVYENLEFMGELYGIDKTHIKEKINEVSVTFGLDEVIKQKAGTLSGGWQRRLSIAMALITDPKVLILDEPTLGLDVLARRELWRAIEKLKGKITIILTTHYLEEAEALCDRIAIMVKGSLKACGTAAELKKIGGNDNFEEAFINIAQKEDI